MRLWSLYPKYLDSQGLVALWRKTLLAKHVLEGKTKGYVNHPPLNRFKTALDSEKTINYYLKEIWWEASRRNYNFNQNKFEEVEDIEKINVTKDQIKFEKNHLQRKLKVRDVMIYNQLSDLATYETHPLFNLIEGGIEPWEKL